ncbi:hypothetical protein QZH41_019110 [Actinostola sp. cb2023]|nr:hypothetical protein QZH41_019110 [Actinostola sp. cb2023]
MVQSGHCTHYSAQYYSSAIAEIGLALLATSIILNFHYRKTRMPTCLRTIIFSYLGPIVRLRNKAQKFAPSSSKLKLELLDSLTVMGIRNKNFFCPDKKSGNKFDLPSSLVVLTESNEAANILFVTAGYFYFVFEECKFVIPVASKGNNTKALDLAKLEPMTRLVLFCIDRVRKFKLGKEAKANPMHPFLFSGFLCSLSTNGC